MSKICTKCKEEKSLNDFSNDKSKKDGKYPSCNKCKYGNLPNKNIQIKKCILCDKNKSIINFGKEKTNTDGYKNRCKECLNEIANQNRKENLEKYRNQQLEFYYRHKDEINKKRKDNLYKYAERIKNYNKQYRIDNKEKIQKYNKEYLKKILTENPNFKIAQSMRRRIRECVKNRSESSKKYIGCSINCLTKWIETQFVEGMTWENYGTIWHIDHVTPCSSFDFSIEENIHNCFCWKNVRPSFVVENLTKSNKYDEELIKSHKIKVEEFIEQNKNLFI